MAVPAAGGACASARAPHVLCCMTRISAAAAEQSRWTGSASLRHPSAAVTEALPARTSCHYLQLPVGASALPRSSGRAHLCSNSVAHRSSLNMTPWILNNRGVCVMAMSPCSCTAPRSRSVRIVFLTQQVLRQRTISTHIRGRRLRVDLRVLSTCENALHRRRWAVVSRRSTVITL